MVKLDGIIRLTEKFKRLAEVLTREPREGRTIINSSGGGFNSPTLDWFMMDSSYTLESLHG
jgi:hypothetical protein